MDDVSQIETLNRRFAIPATAEVLSGSNGLPRVRITTQLACAEIYLHGAQVTSWQPAGAEEVLFLSQHSHWQDGRAIRGGIPICFPWFRAKADDPQAPAHGVVRTREWQLESIKAAEDGSVTVTLSIQSDEATHRWWPHDFRLVHRITIGSALSLDLTATNTGATPLHFEEALHTYFRVGDASSARVHGLDRVTYLDNTDANREKVQSGDVLFTAATDNAYLNTRAALHLVDPILHRTIRTDKENSATTVVWNPWQQGAASLADLGDEEWQHLLCVEASNILSAAVSLAPGQQHTLRATVSLVP